MWKHCYFAIQQLHPSEHMWGSGTKQCTWCPLPQTWLYFILTAHTIIYMTIFKWWRYLDPFLSYDFLNSYVPWKWKLRKLAVKLRVTFCCINQLIFILIGLYDWNLVHIYRPLNHTILDQIEINCQRQNIFLAFLCINCDNCYLISKYKKYIKKIY